MIDIKNYSAPNGAAVLVNSREELIRILEHFEECSVRWFTDCRGLGGERATENLETILMAVEEYEYGDLCLGFYKPEFEDGCRMIPHGLMINYADRNCYEDSGYRIFTVSEIVDDKPALSSRNVIMTYYAMSVCSVEQSGDRCAALNYTNVYYDKESALEAAHTLKSRTGAIQVIVCEWNLFEDGTEDATEDGYLFSWYKDDETNMKG